MTMQMSLFLKFLHPIPNVILQASVVVLESGLGVKTILVSVSTAFVLVLVLGVEPVL